MKQFYFDVEITGTALVYAETADEARTLIAEAGVIVAGNKLRGTDLQVLSAPRDRVTQ